MSRSRSPDRPELAILPDPMPGSRVQTARSRLRLLAFALTLFLLTAGCSLGGCGSQPTTGSGDPTGPTGPTGSSTAAGSADGTNQPTSIANPGSRTGILTFKIWDVYQQPAMQALADRFTDSHPGVQIDLEISTWEEYWIEFEVAVAAGSMPDVFWMHRNEFEKYTANGLLMDLTDLLSTPDSEPGGYGNFKGAIVSRFTDHGRIYGVPKDWDTVALAYNKTLFDQAEEKYPTDAWTWDTLAEVAGEIQRRTGKYGFVAPYDNQSGYANLVYQAGGFIVENGRAGYSEPAARLAIHFWYDLMRKNKVSPDYSVLSETDANTLFQKGNVAMQFLGSWNLLAYSSNDSITGQFDVAVLPRCPNPLTGTGRATIGNSLAYSAAGNTAEPEFARQFLRYLASREANVLQAESGTAIPAFIGTEQIWMDCYPGYHVGVYQEMLPYAHDFAVSKTKSRWVTIESTNFMQVYLNGRDLDEAIDATDKAVEALLALE